MLILQEVRSKRLKIDDLNERIMRLRSAMVIGERRLDLAPAKTAVRNKLENDMCKLDELERELLGRLIELEELAQDADYVLEAAELPAKYEEVVRLRYCYGLKWSLVARNTDYSIIQCKRIGYAVAEKMIRNDTF